jgi:hypothetical protein
MRISLEAHLGNTASTINAPFAHWKSGNRGVFWESWRTIKQAMEMVCEVQQTIRVCGGHNTAGLTRRGVTVLVCLLMS